MLSMLYTNSRTSATVGRPRLFGGEYLVNIPLLKALIMIVFSRRSVLLALKPSVSQVLISRLTQATHRFRPVRLKCRAKLRMHARTRSPITEQPKPAETSHCIRVPSVRHGRKSMKVTWLRRTLIFSHCVKVGSLALNSMSMMND